MMKVLAIGGNRLFGKRLVKLLIHNQHEVTVLNRKNIDDGFVDKVQCLKYDRLNIQDMNNVLGDNYWDVVYDQVCYDHDTARNACEIFKHRTGHYIHTSPQSVYSYGKEITEDFFTPENHQFNQVVSSENDYAETKKKSFSETLKRGYHLSRQKMLPNL